MSLTDVMAKYNKTKPAGATMVGRQLLDDNNVKLVLKKDSITLSDAREAVFKANYSLMPVNDTFVAMGAYATIIAHRSPKQVKDINSKMVQLNASSFMDEELGSIWSKENIEGSEYFTRENDVNIDEILQSVTAISMLASFDFSTFNPKYSLGSTVDIYVIKDGRPQTLTGKVCGIEKQNVCVMTDDGKVEVASGAVVKTYETPAEMNEVVKHLGKAYNPKDGSMDYGKLFKERGV
jgi:hypothetical protein